MPGLMMFDYFGDSKRAFDQAKEEKRVGGLRELAGQYYGQQDPMLGKVAALGGDAGGMQRDMQGQEDRKREQLGQFAGMLLNAPPQMRPSVYKQIQPQLAAMGLEAPPEYTPEIDGFAQTIAQQFGRGAQNTGIQSTFVDARGVRMGVTRDGRTVELGQNAANVQLVEGQGGYFGVDKGKLSARPVTMGAPQPAAPAPGTNDQVLAVANQMAQAGIPPQFIEQWMAKQPGMQAVSQQDAPQAAMLPMGQQLRPAPKPEAGGYATLSAREVADLGLPVGTVAQRGPNGQVQIVNKPRDLPGAQSTVIDNGDGTQTIIPAGKTTEDQNKAAGWYQSSKNALQNLREVIKQDPSALFPGVIEAYVPGQELKQRSMSPTRQRAAHAFNTMKMDFLHAATGAGFTVAEAEDEWNNLAPQRGNSPALVEQKLGQIEVKLNAMRQRAGGAVPVQTGAPKAGKYSVGQVITHNGKKYRVTGGDLNDPDVEEVK